MTDDQSPGPATPPGAPPRGRRLPAAAQATLVACAGAALLAALFVLPAIVSFAAPPPANGGGDPSQSAAFQPTPYLAAYGATKAFVLNWSLALNEELRGTGVRTLALCPGPTSTDFFQRAGLKEGAVPTLFGETSEQVVRVTLKALGRGKSMVVSGWKNKLMTASVSQP